VTGNGFWDEDRKGVKCSLPFTTNSIGAVVVTPSACRTHEDVASAAATAKRRAKAVGSGLHVFDLHLSPTSNPDLARRAAAEEDAAHPAGRWPLAA
jgi:hypothetical protein